MDLVYLGPLVAGYLVFVYLSERLWPFSRPRGHVAERRYGKGCAFGLITGSLMFAALAGLLMPPSTAMVVALIALTVVVLASLQLRRGSGHPASRSPALAARLAKAVEGNGDAGRGATRDRAEETYGAHQASPTPATALSAQRLASLSFLNTHRPDIPLGDAAPRTGSCSSARPLSTAQGKLDAVVATHHLNDEQRRRFERDNGLRNGALGDWRQACEQAIDSSRRARERQRKIEGDYEQRIDSLQAELARKDHALAEAATDLMLRQRRAERA